MDIIKPEECHIIFNLIQRIIKNHNSNNINKHKYPTLSIYVYILLLIILILLLKLYQKHHTKSYSPSTNCLIIDKYYMIQTQLNYVMKICDTDTWYHPIILSSLEVLSKTYIQD